MPLIPDRLWEQLTEDERDLITSYVDGFRHEPRITCPHCGGGIAVKVKVTAGATRIDEESGERIRSGPQTTLPGGRSVPTKDTLGASERVLVESARTSGVLAAFMAAMRTEKEHAGIPGNIEEFFLLFWKTAVPTKVPSVTLAAWIEEFGGRIDVMQAQGICAVFSDGLLMTFFPNRLTAPSDIGKGGRSGRTGQISNTAAFETWRRGKFGYVPVEARTFADALRQRNIGAFGTLVQ